MRHIYSAFGWFYSHWGTMSTLIVGLIAFVLSLLPSTIAKLEKNLFLKIAVPIIVGVVAITGYVRSKSNAGALQGQISAMYQQLKSGPARPDIENLATNSEVERLMGHVDSGFSRLAEALSKANRAQVALPKLKSNQNPTSNSQTQAARPEKPPAEKPSQATPVPVPPIAAPPQITVTQERTLPSGPNYKYGLRVTIQSNETVPVSFAIQCSGSVGSIDAAFLVGQGAYLSKLTGISGGDTAVVKFGYPPLTPQSPLIVVLSSNEDIHVLKVSPYEQ